jgi:hypothetical protein
MPNSCLLVFVLAARRKTRGGRTLYFSGSAVLLFSNLTIVFIGVGRDVGSGIFLPAPLTVKSSRFLFNRTVVDLLHAATTFDSSSKALASCWDLILAKRD